jgi:hypothetical protein
VNTSWINTNLGFGHDTSDIILTLFKSEIDSILDLSFNPEYSNGEFSFKFKDGQFISTTNYHPPILKLTNSRLYFKHQPGLGPFWIECFTNKTQ